MASYEPGSCDMMVLDRFIDAVLEQRPNATMAKGVPIDFPGSYRQLGEEHRNLFDGTFPTPVAVLNGEALSDNIAWMTRYLGHMQVSIAPHGKTSMSPQLFKRQLAGGAWGITAASVQQAAFFARAGIRRILIANEITAAADISSLVGMVARIPDLEIFVLADNARNVEELSERACAAHARLNVLLELGVEHARSGVRKDEYAIGLAHRIHGLPGLALAGIEAYEGVIKRDTVEENVRDVTALLRRVLFVANACEKSSLWDCAEVLLTAGGTDYFDLCAHYLRQFASALPIRVVIRSGCYITSDDGDYAEAIANLRRRLERNGIRCGSLRAAIEVWGSVISMPEPGLALVNIGKRDVSHDWSKPRAVKWRARGDGAPRSLEADEWPVTGLNDQHAFLSVPENSPLQVGDLVGFGINHPCTTFDKWSTLLLVDSSYEVSETIRTFF
ncbi:MAG: alanine racemase [Bifidobacterium sp.]|nr:alanine racemase [Bifidobacterium sp.]MCI1865349.1 alanine racemase [Bifidobacterium sp.]